MKLNIGIAARDRQFAQSLRRIRPQISELETAFEEVEMLDALQTSTLIIVTDENDPGTLKEVKNNEGVFQVIAGFSTGLSDEDMKRELSKIVRATVEASKFSDPDREAFLKLVESWEEERI